MKPLTPPKGWAGDAGRTSSEQHLHHIWLLFFVHWNTNTHAWVCSEMVCMQLFVKIWRTGNLRRHSLHSDDERQPRATALKNMFWLKNVIFTQFAWKLERFFLSFAAKTDVLFYIRTYQFILLIHGGWHATISAVRWVVEPKGHNTESQNKSNFKKFQGSV